MRPFPHHATKSNHLTSASPAPQQTVGGNNNMLPNLMQLQSQMGFANPQLPIPNSNFNPDLASGNIPATFMNTPNFNDLRNNYLGGSIMYSGQQFQSSQGFSPHNFGQNLNVLGFPFNGQLSNLGQGNPNQSYGHNPMVNGQFGLQNQFQQMNQLGNMPLLNPAQVNALTQLLGCANQVAQAIMPQNTAFLGNPQLGYGQPDASLQQNNFSQQLPVVSQQLPIVSAPPSNHSAPTHLHGQPSNFKGNHGQKQGMQTSNSIHHQNKNFVNPKRDSSNLRFQNSHGRQVHNPKGKPKFSNANEGKGIINAGPDNSASPSKTGKKRSLAMFYTEKEILQWREERKKNYPSKQNEEKRLAQKQADADAADEAAKFRRQQLKDILAKQVELGFEVPEIPSHYLLDPEHQSHGRDKYGRPLKKGRFSNNGRFQNKFNNRDGNFDRKDRFAKRGTEEGKSFTKHDRFAKRQRVEGGDPAKTLLSKKEPTLLQKLLSTDIKRDNSRLLQAFRFMVINSFFKDWPEKPLNFPNVIVKEPGAESDVIEDAHLFEGELGNNEDLGICDEKDGKKDGHQEEGEITD